MDGIKVNWMPTSRATGHQTAAPHAVATAANPEGCGAMRRTRPVCAGFGLLATRSPETRIWGNFALVVEDVYLSK